MPDVFQNLLIGVSVAVSPENLFYCFAGALIGVLPGLGPVTTIAMLLPLTFSLPATSALIMLARIYYGSHYGGSTTAILVNMPGENSSVVTCTDGYQMARQGRAGPALAVAALGSLFGAAEYLSLIVLGMIASVVLAHGSILKALGMIVLGVFLSTIGSTVGSALPRMTFGIRELNDGIGFVPLAMGLFALSEILANMGKPEDRTVVSGELGRLWPTRGDFRRIAPGVVRSSLLGSFLLIARRRRHDLLLRRLYVRKKAFEGAAPFRKRRRRGRRSPRDGKQRRCAGLFHSTAYIGHPGECGYGAHGGRNDHPGHPTRSRGYDKEPGAIWGLIMSMWIGNVMLVVINLPLIRIWVSLLKVPYRLFAPTLLVLCCIGVYTLNNSTFEVMLLVVFGLLGYVLRKWAASPGR